MEAIILAGGFGTRLAHIVKDVPKPMAPVANHPFLEYILDYLKENGITKVVFATGYKHDIIEKYFGNAYNEMKLLYSVEDTPLLTGGAIKKALTVCEDDNIFIINGDTYFDVDLDRMKEFHNLNNADITIATKLMYDFNRYGTVTLNNDKIIKFREKEYNKEGLINGGIYLVNRSILADIKENKFSFEQDIMEKKVLELSIYSFASKGYFIDIGIPEDYKKANEELLKT